MNTLILTNEEAEMFKHYMKYHDLFVTMEAVGAFNVQYGKVILNCAGGLVQNIVKEEIAWRR